jgi:3'-phosphoadenosine 5'-phosphosulfate sulfotransferase (PAPS reductase)/FAD synthetase
MMACHICNYWTPERGCSHYGPDPEICPPQIQELIQAGALFVINHSGGKDSQAMTIRLEKMIPARQLVIIHAELPGVDWPGINEHIESTSLGIPVNYCRAKKTFFEMVEKRQMFPSPQQRQCTSDLKRDPIQVFINRYARDNKFTQVVNCSGIRADESPNRSKKNPLKISARATTKSRTQWEWMPIFSMNIRQVWQEITTAGQRRHPIYEQGMTRLSCCFCIMASKQDLRTAARLNPELAKKYMETEERIGFTMSMERIPLRQIIN